jgi:hypothetical protein
MTEAVATTDDQRSTQTSRNNPDSLAVGGEKQLGGVMRAAVLAVVVAIASGCSLLPAPTPATTAWRDRVPEAAPEVIAAQPIVARGPNSITLLPISPTGAVVGNNYTYDMPHCGINSPIDVDGSFWDAVGVPLTSVDFDGQTGTFRLIAPTEATFTASDGKDLRLVRHSGAKEFRLCA